MHAVLPEVQLLEILPSFGSGQGLDQRRHAPDVAKSYIGKKTTTFPPRSILDAALRSQWSSNVAEVTRIGHAGSHGDRSRMGRAVSMQTGHTGSHPHRSRNMQSHGRRPGGAGLPSAAMTRMCCTPPRIRQGRDDCLYRQQRQGSGQDCRGPAPQVSARGATPGFSTWLLEIARMLGVATLSWRAPPNSVEASWPPKDEGK